MKAGKSKKNSAVPSSADKKRVAPSKAKSPGVKAAAAKLSSATKRVVEAARAVAARVTKDKATARKRGTEAAASKTKTVLRSEQPKKKETVPRKPSTKSMPAPIVKSAFKGETSTPGISPAPIPPKPIAAVAPVVAPAIKPSVAAAPAAAVAPKPRVVRQPRPAPVEIPAILLEPDL